MIEEDPGGSTLACNAQYTQSKGKEKSTKPPDHKNSHKFTIQFYAVCSKVPACMWEKNEDK